eukprot:SAG31_NODE_9864_length_1219_cov_1.393750_1_plen_143_part_10
MHLSPWRPQTTAPKPPSRRRTWQSARCLGPAMAGERSALSLPPALSAPRAFGVVYTRMRAGRYRLERSSLSGSSRPGSSTRSLAAVQSPWPEGLASRHDWCRAKTHLAGGGEGRGAGRTIGAVRARWEESERFEQVKPWLAAK